MSISFGDNENSEHGHLKLCSKVTPAYGNIHLKTIAYHYFSKALEDVKEVMVSGGLLQVSNEQCPSGLWMKLVNPFIQGPKLILTFRL